MIPLHLSLSNFLSYRDGRLDFSGIHTACICGANGSGKSSLLEALTWVLWGKSRADSDDDVVRRGATEARVDLTFSCEGQRFRIIRTRVTGKTSSLEFQVGDGDSFRTLTRSSLRVTQEAINEVLKMDYDTFINSAYLRQGRADEFTVKRPAERKEVLVEILNLNRYEQLCERSKEHEKQFAGRAQVLADQLQRSRLALGERPMVQARRDTTAGELEALRAQQTQIQQRLELLSTRSRQREQLAGQLERLDSQITQTHQTHSRLHAQCERQTRVVRELEVLLEQEAQIAQGCARYQQLLAEEAAMGERGSRHQTLTVRRTELERRLDGERHQLELQLQRHKSRFDGLTQQRREAQAVLEEAPKIEQGLAELARVRELLTSYDQRQREVFPHTEEKLQLEREIHRVYSELAAQIPVYEQQQRKLQQDLSRRGFLEQTFQKVSEKVEQLEKKRVYQQRVTEKGLERSTFEAKLRAQQQQYRKELDQLAEKAALLAQGETDCPLCGGPLDAEHRELLGEQHQRQHAELEDHLTLLAHQISAAEHEVRVLRTEYSELVRELEQLPSLLQQQAQLRQQLSAVDESSGTSRQLRSQIQAIRTQLERGDYAQDLKARHTGVLQQIQIINYDEKDHAMARSEADRWRWAEIRAGELERARRQLGQIEAEIPALEQTCHQIESQLTHQQYGQELQNHLRAAAEQLQSLGYDGTAHQNLRKHLQDHLHWLSRQQELIKARNRHPEERGVLQELQKAWAEGKDLLVRLGEQRVALQAELDATPDPREALAAAQAEELLNRRHQEHKLSELGAADQRLAQIDALQEQIAHQQSQLEHAQKQQALYKELTRAFGKNGIQALIIENVLPELETETNRLLSRLCDSQLHVQFITQRASKNAKKLIDTLDILIADARGTRPYETYSGGEAYRVNFAIRLALSRLLARRSGAALQTLIIDEGFGTQDLEGRNRLVQSINTVADDFACILVITHIHELKEAFQSRIEVEKDHQGSQLSVVL
ncbi:AAA family ATPase [Gloeobacter violaceus]|uniref:Nuclease SbcCD subunit C n=1 Tax=Gloeobacter violaceus (strain ATCC 29082 / PCC 7421) TaxID=251221 RepID=Q7NCW4_GLOVI|nr:SMC family ATPase [Gloeobacter violaceus]BAC90803.1 glr2862 [Gloeobacter violaceus PCC 7421]